MDIINKKKYIFKMFKYMEYAEQFSKSIKLSIRKLAILPNRYSKTGFMYRGYNIYVKSCLNNLIFYIIDDEKLEVKILRVIQDDMNWEYVLNLWIELS